MALDINAVNTALLPVALNQPAVSNSINGNDAPAPLLQSTLSAGSALASLDTSPLANLRNDAISGTTDTGATANTALFPASITALLPSLLPTPTPAVGSDGQLELFNSSALAEPEGLSLSTPTGLLGLADYLAVQSGSSTSAGSQGGLSVFV